MHLGSARALRAGLRIKGKQIVRRAKAERARGAARMFGLVVFGVGTAVLVFLVALAGGAFVRMKGAPDLARTGTSALLLGVSGALVLSSLGHAANAFFSAKDLWFWDASPARPWARFVDRAVETALSALPMPLALGAVAQCGLVLGAGLGAGAAVRGVVAVALSTLVPLSLGILLAHVGGALLPAGRLRRHALFVVGVLTACALVWFRRARLEKILTPEGAAELIEDARGVATLGPAWLPSSRGADFVVDGDPTGFALLAASSAALVALALWSHVALFRRARDLAVDESPVGLVRGSLRERALRAALRPSPQRLRPLVEKDLLGFARDPAQWGQLVLLVGVGAIYLASADAFLQGLEGLPPVAAEAMFAGMHVGLVTFIAAGLGARFGFPQMGLEGPAVWIVDGSPLSARDLVLAKWLGAIPIVALFPASVAAIGGFVLALSTGSWIVTTTLVLCTALGLAAYSVGRGAVSPAFDAANVSDLAMGPGAISTMVTSVVVAGLAALAAAAAGAALRFAAGPGTLMFALCCAALPPLVAIFLGQRALRAGARAFVARREEEAARAFAAGAPAPSRSAAGPL